MLACVDCLPIEYIIGFYIDYITVEPKCRVARTTI
jgi:hypothetical protein